MIRMGFRSWIRHIRQMRCVCFDSEKSLGASAQCASCFVLAKSGFLGQDFGGRVGKNMTKKMTKGRGRFDADGYE